MSKIGIMGGTFNPIHNGHLALAEYAMDELKLDEIWFIPTGCSYMKKDVPDILPGEERLMMAQLATQDNERMKCLDIEIKRDGYTYSYETLEQLKCEYPGKQFYFIFGADCLFTIENWRYPERIFENCTVVAAVRNGADVVQMKHKIAELSDKYHTDICLLPFLNLEISSTMIRERIRDGKSVRYLTPDSVTAYINQKQFYREKE